MGDEEVGVGRAGLLDDRKGRVEGEQDALDRLVGITRHETHLVPRLRGVWRVETFEDGDDIAQEKGHVGPAGLEPTTPAV